MCLAFTLREGSAVYNPSISDNKISGDKINNGTIDSITISQLGGALNVNDKTITNVNIDSGVIDGTDIGLTTPAVGTFTNITASGNISGSGTEHSFGGKVGIGT